MTEKQMELRRVLDMIACARKRQRNSSSMEMHIALQQTIDKLSDEEADLHNAVAEESRQAYLNSKVTK